MLTKKVSLWSYDNVCSTRVNTEMCFIDNTEYTHSFLLSPYSDDASACTHTAGVRRSVVNMYHFWIQDAKLTSTPPHHHHISLSHYTPHKATYWIAILFPFSTQSVSHSVAWGIHIRTRKEFSWRVYSLTAHVSSCVCLVLYLWIGFGSKIYK